MDARGLRLGTTFIARLNILIDLLHAVKSLW